MAAGRPPIQFGISVTPYAERYQDIVEQVLAADRGGLDLVGIQTTYASAAIWRRAADADCLLERGEPSCLRRRRVKPRVSPAG